MALDTRESSVITDHAFKPRLDMKWVDTTPPGSVRPSNVWLSPNPYLCKVCRLAEAAHRETTVTR